MFGWFRIISTLRVFRHPILERLNLSHCIYSNAKHTGQWVWDCQFEPCPTMSLWQFFALQSGTWDMAGRGSRFGQSVRRQPTATMQSHEQQQARSARECLHKSKHKPNLCINRSTNNIHRSNHLQYLLSFFIYPHFLHTNRSSKSTSWLNLWSSPGRPTAAPWAVVAWRRAAPGVFGGGFHWRWPRGRGLCMIVHYLVGGWFTPLKNMSSSIGMIIFQKYSQYKGWLFPTLGWYEYFQTTNPYWDDYSQY